MRYTVSLRCSQPLSGQEEGGRGERGQGGNRAPIFHREREGASTPNSKFDNFIQGQKEFTKPNFNLHPTHPLPSTTCIWYLAITRLACNGTKQYRKCRNALIISDHLSFDVLFSGIYREHSPSSGPNVVLVH